MNLKELWPVLKVIYIGICLEGFRKPLGEDSCSMLRFETGLWK
jgi:hypothetical protein